MEEMNTLYIYIDSQDLTLLDKYIESVQKHNTQIESDYYDSGFDLFNPREILIDEEDYSRTYKLDTQFKCAMFDKNNKPCSFYLYARSSISKTHFRLANNVGIIDSNYRGNLIGVFDIIDPNKEHSSNFVRCISMEKYSRLLQICSGDLKPFKVRISDTLEQLGFTERGEGGIGSTGK
jgi:dUTP pyrophosphatase